MVASDKKRGRRASHVGRRMVVGPSRELDPATCRVQLPGRSLDLPGRQDCRWTRPPHHPVSDTECALPMVASDTKRGRLNGRVGHKARTSEWLRRTQSADVRMLASDTKRGRPNGRTVGYLGLGVPWVCGLGAGSLRFGCSLLVLLLVLVLVLLTTWGPS